MNTKLYIFSLILLMFAQPVGVMAQTDSLEIQEPQIEKPRSVQRYERRVRRYQKRWYALMPTHSVIHYAGNMGLISVGAGWDYGKHRQWETQLFVGVLPKYDSNRTKMTMTLKENYVPWHIPTKKWGWQIEPLSCGLYFNTVFGGEFWSREPDRYPEDYYPLLKTKVRANVFLGQRITKAIPHNKRKFLAKSVTLYYKISTCDLYIRAMVQDKTLKPSDIIGLSLGVKMQIF